MEYSERKGYYNFVNQKKIDTKKLLELWNNEHNTNLKNPINIYRRYGWNNFVNFVNKNKKEVCGNDFSFWKDDDEKIMIKEERQIAKKENPKMMNFLSKLKTLDISNELIFKVFYLTYNYKPNAMAISLVGKMQPYLGVFKEEDEIKIINNFLCYINLPKSTKNELKGKFSQYFTE